MKDKNFIMEKNIQGTTEKISKATFEFFNNETKKQIKYHLDKNCLISKHDVFHITSASIFDVLINVFINIERTMEKENIKKTEFNKLVRSYADGMLKYFLIKHVEHMN